jgi:hypothetical protein
MTAIDDISTIGGTEDSISPEGTVDGQLAFLHDQLATLRDFFCEQITKLESSLAKSEQSNLLLQAKLELLVQ